MNRLHSTLRTKALLSLLLVFLGSSPLQADGIGLNVGEFRLTETGGRTHSISSYKDSVMVIIFWSFRCPVALAYQARLSSLCEKYRASGVVCAAVDPMQNESPEEIKLNSANLNLTFPVLLDDQGALADRLDITHIPAAIVLDRGSVVRYLGSVDNNKQVGDRARIPYLEDALDSVLAGRPVATPESKLFGCSTKRKTP